MPGTLGLATPWARKAFTDEERHEVRDLIPDGCVVGVAGHAHGGGRTFIVWGLAPDGHEVIRLEHRHDPVEAARVIARRLAVLA